MDGSMPPAIAPAWNEFRHLSPPNLDQYAEIFEHPQFFPLQRRAELAWMMRQARAIEPRTVVEIGSDKGGGFYHWNRSLSATVERSLGIEIRGVPWLHGFQRLFDHQVYGLAECSRSAIVLELARAIAPIDCLFIDGEKARARDDFETWLPFMRKGGLVFFHDTRDDIEPARVFKSLRGRFATTEFVDGREGTDAQVRKGGGESPRSEHDAWAMHWGPTSCGVGMVQV